VNRVHLKVVFVNLAVVNLALAVVALAAAGCATPPKPSELQALENLRATNQAKLP